MSVELIPMTRELYHELFDGYEYDPVIFKDVAEYEKYRGFVYDRDRVDAHYDSRVSRENYLTFAVSVSGSVIGEAVLKHIDQDKKSCELGIHLKNDGFKNKGFGTEAEKLAVEYAFRELGMECVTADCLMKNVRSQRVLEKVGFIKTGEEDGFVRYELRKKHEII